MVHGNWASHIIPTINIMVWWKITIATWSCVINIMYLKWWYLHNRINHTVAFKMAENQQQYPGVASYTVSVKVHSLNRCVCVWGSAPCAIYIQICINNSLQVADNFYKDCFIRCILWIDWSIYTIMLYYKTSKCTCPIMQVHDPCLL